MRKDVSVESSHRQAKGLHDGRDDIDKLDPLVEDALPGLSREPYEKRNPVNRLIGADAMTEKAMFAKELAMV